MPSIWEQLKAIFTDSQPDSVVFKDEWAVMLESNLPLYLRFNDTLKQKVHEKISQFVATTYFEGCNGLELTNEMILTVAGQACTLIVNHDGPPYPNLKTVLLYPSPFSSIQDGFDASGNPIKERVTLLGESWSNGTVILAWDSVKSGARNIFDGRNVTFHEFAHQLDQEDGQSDGVPYLEAPHAYHAWGEALCEGYLKLLDKAEKGKRSVLDHYGATNHAEFFAVATECFFEKPKQVKKKHPKPYAELKAYYRLDPIDWRSGNKNSEPIG